jgi:hypothetical protein
MPGYMVENFYTCVGNDVGNNKKGLEMIFSKPFILLGSPRRTRTANLVVNSHPLCH